MKLPLPAVSNKAIACAVAPLIGLLLNANPAALNAAVPPASLLSPPALVSETPYSLPTTFELAKKGADKVADYDGADLAADLADAAKPAKASKVSKSKVAKAAPVEEAPAEEAAPA